MLFSLVFFICKTRRLNWMSYVSLNSEIPLCFTEKQWKLRLSSWVTILLPCVVWTHTDYHREEKYLSFWKNICLFGSQLVVSTKPFYSHDYFRLFFFHRKLDFII